jgi:YbbR domain-containing protein
MVSSQRAAVERGLRIPLELQNLPQNLEMVEPPPESVDVRVRGAADTVGRLVAGDLVATVDLGSAQAGRRLFHLSPERVKAPFAVAVTQLTPSTVAIRFEPSATRIVPVQPSVEGEPAAGFIVGTISSDPPTVEIIGPESVLRRVTEAITEPLWVGSAKSDVRSSVILGVADPGVRLKTVKNAIVSVAIVPAPEERQLTSVPVRTRNLASGLSARMTPPTVKVRVRGDKQTIEKIRDAAIVAYVDLGGIGEGDYGLPVRLEPVAGVGVDQLYPTIVNIRVQ